MMSTEMTTNHYLLKVLTILAALALAAGLLAHSAKPAEAAFPGKNGKIVFSSNRSTGQGVQNPEKDFEIFMINRNGSGLKQLTKNAVSDYQPAVSPDGKKIAFSKVLTANPTNTEIYVMDANGSNEERLTYSGTRDESPAWSPDGSEIAFQTDRENGDMEIYRMGANGGAQNNISHNNNAGDSQPAWSPDGERIAFVSTKDGNPEIYTMRTDVYHDPNQIRLTHSPGTDFEPSWSPDGKRIAFSSYRDGNYEIYTMNRNGGNELNRSNHPAQDISPAFSPNGALVAFVSTRQQNYKSVFTMKANGESQLATTIRAEYPDWQPLPS